jgi:chemotaxis protein methyltransferase CheR
MQLLPTVATIKQLAHQLRFRYRLRFQPRQSRIHSYFYRFPNQYRALVEKVLPERLRADPSLAQRPLEILVFAACRGEEVYTLAYLLERHFPSLDFRIRGYDIDSGVVATAREGKYTKEELHGAPFVTEEIVQGMFDAEVGGYRVKPRLRQRTAFEVGDMTDPRFVASLGPCDLMFAQNVLFHLPIDVAPRVFESLYGITAAGGTLFINGVDMDMRVRLTKKFKLEPVEYLIQEIHEDARVDRGSHWSNQYWGRVPFSRQSPDWVREFGTIYTKES